MNAESLPTCSDGGQSSPAWSAGWNATLAATRMRVAAGDDLVLWAETAVEVATGEQVLRAGEVATGEQVRRAVEVATGEQVRRAVAGP